MPTYTEEITSWLLKTLIPMTTGNIFMIELKVNFTVTAGIVVPSIAHP